MATLVDELIVALSLDPLKFQSGVDTVKRGAADVERSAKGMQEALGGVERGMMRLGALFIGFTGMAGFVTWIANITKATAELSFLSRQLNTSMRDLYAWQRIGQNLGISPEQVTAGYAGLSNRVADFLTGQGQGTGAMRYLAQRGVQFYRRDQQTGMRVPNDETSIIMQAAQATRGLPAPIAASILRGAGFNEALTSIIINNQNNLQQLSKDLQSFKQQAPSPEEARKAALSLQEFNKAYAETEKLGRELGTLVLPAVNNILRDGLLPALKSTETDIENITILFDKLLGAWQSFDRWFTSTWIYKWASRVGQAAGGTGGTTPFTEPPADIFGGDTSKNMSFRRFGNFWNGTGSNTVEPGASVPSQNLPAQRDATRRQLAQQWRDAGVPESGVAAILANVERESGFNSNSRVADQPKFSGEAHFAHGLYQEGGTEWNNYSRWLAQNHPGQPWQDPKLQTEFLMQNLQKNYPKVWAALNNPNLKASQKAMIFQQQYLRPKYPHFGDAGRAEQYAARPPSPPDQPNVASDGWGNNLRAIPWLKQGGGISFIKGMPANTYNNSSTSETHIGQFTVNTNDRANPWGMASQIKDAVQRAGIMNNSNQGPN